MNLSPRSTALLVLVALACLSIIVRAPLDSSKTSHTETEGTLAPQTDIKPNVEAPKAVSEPVKVEVISQVLELVETKEPVKPSSPDDLVPDENDIFVGICNMDKKTFSDLPRVSDCIKLGTDTYQRNHDKTEVVKALLAFQSRVLDISESKVASKFLATWHEDARVTFDNTRKVQEQEAKVKEPKASKPVAKSDKYDKSKFVYKPSTPTIDRLASLICDQGNFGLDPTCGFMGAKIEEQTKNSAIFGQALSEYVAEQTGKTSSLILQTAYTQFEAEDRQSQQFEAEDRIQNPSR